MIKSRKLQLLIALILVCTCGLVPGAEPNEAKTELKFEIRSDRPPQLLSRLVSKPIFGSTHFAVLFIRGDWGSHPAKSVDAILATSAGRAMSQKQRDLVSTFPFLFRDFGRTIGNHAYFRLYGVCEDDTKKMVEAFIEILAKNADAKVQEYEKLLNETKEKIIEIKKELPEKQKQFKAAESNYKEIKNARYFVSLHDGEVYTKAMETMFQMDKMLDTLEIELAGIREKMKSIELFRRGPEPVRNQSNQVNLRLDEMFVEQMVELRGVEARKKAALRIRNREKEFLDLFNRWGSFEVEVEKLKKSLSGSEERAHKIEEKLANPEPNMLPPKVYQNKVTIYPVRGGR